MASKFSELASVVASIEREGNRNSVFAFVCSSSPLTPYFVCKSPLTALMRLRDHLSGQPGFSGACKEKLSESTYQLVVSGEYQLVELHLFVKFKDEHILAQPKFGRSVQVARRQSRGQNASGALPASIYGHPPIDYEGLPRDEDL